MEYTIRQGDTLELIAQRHLGDASLWVVIAEQNNLVYPYISSTPSNGVATYGDVIFIGMENVDIIVDEPSFGSDLRLTTDKTVLSYGMGGDLMVDMEGDLVIVQEIDCLVQDLSHRLVTPLGTLPHHPRYGSYLNDTIGRKKDDSWKIKSTLEISRTIKCDPRILDVDDISIWDFPTGARIDYTAVTEKITFRAGEVVGDEEI